MMQKRILFATSTSQVVEELLALTTRLSAEGHLPAILGPSNPDHYPECQVFTRVGDAQEFKPDIVYPLDLKATLALRQFSFPGSKTLNDNELAHTLSSRWSFGLSLMAKAGALTVNYHVVANENDWLQLQAKQAQSGEGQWGLYLDDPTAIIPREDGNLAIQMEEGEIVHLCYLISGKHLVQPAISYWTLSGLLPRGGLRDYRGVYLKPCWSQKVDYFGQKLLAAAQAVGTSGLIFLDLLVPKSNPGQSKVLRVSTVPSGGFLMAFTAPGFFKRNLGLTLLSLAKGSKDTQAVWDYAGAYALLVTDPLGAPQHRQALGLLPGDEFLALPGEVSIPYWLGYYRGVSADVPDALWEAVPTAEVKLDANRLSGYAEAKLREYHLLHDSKEDSTDVSDGSSADSGGDSCRSIGGPELDPGEPFEPLGCGDPELLAD